MTNKLISFFLLLFAIFFSSSVHAAPPSRISHTFNGTLFTMPGDLCTYLQNYWRVTHNRPGVTATCAIDSAGRGYKVNGYDAGNWLYSYPLIDLVCAPGEVVNPNPATINDACGVAPPVPDQCPTIRDAGNVTVTMGYKSHNSDSAPKVINFYPNESDTPVTRTYCGPQNCRIKPKEPVFSCQRNSIPSSNGYYEVACTFASDQVGGVCTGSEAPKNPPPPTTPPVPPVPPGQMPCPAGSVPTGLDKNGIMVCTGTSNPPVPPKVTTDKPPVVTQNSDGSTTTTTTTMSSNSDGSTTTQTTVTKVGADGGKTTTTSSTTTPAAGGATGDSPGKEDAPPSDFCVQNPQLSICKNSTVAGTCGEVSCTGDAIQCATLRAAAAMECRQSEDKKFFEASSLTALGDQLSKGVDPNASSTPSPDNAKVVTMPSSLNGSGWLAGGSLPADKSFTLQGHTIVIPLSRALAYLVVLRYAMMIVALLASFKILSGAIIRE